MSAYRAAPLQKWRVLYKVPLLDRIGRSAVVIGFSVLGLVGLSMAVLAPFLSDVAGFALAGFGLMAAFTAGTLLTITWLTRLPEVVEHTIASVAGDEQRPSRCRIFAGGEQWTLPVAITDLAPGQRLRVSYREIAPQDDIEPGREVLEVRVVED